MPEVKAMPLKYRTSSQLQTSDGPKMFSSIPFRLHTDKEHKTYDNMQDWWVNQAKCSSNYIISQDDMI